ncbi:MAG: hypothetical protein P4L92_22840 [Rudaea sp.]|nr:hypothetical protein [Rudaea sp.]
MIQLGRVYKDKVTGFEGVATGYVQYLTGCNQALLAPKVGSDGASREAHWLDEQRLDAVGDTVITLNNAASPGFDKPAPKR